MVKTIKTLKVTPTERHFELRINKKIVQISKWVDDDFCTDYEFIKGEEALNDDEREEVLDYIEDKRI
jgi:hypothetical protein